MPKMYITFGQIHVHKFGQKLFDKDSVAVIEAATEKEGRDKADKLFSRVYHQSYFGSAWKEEEHLKWYPRGYINVD